MNDSFRSGYVAIIGEPNVGKSTLMNAILGQKISIVSSKPQTTRHVILGILTGDGHQVVFLDTPGILKPKYRLHEAMMSSANSAVADADVIVFMVDAAAPVRERQHDLVLDALKRAGKPVFLLINKIDLVAKQQILPLIAGLSVAFPFEEIFPVSALTLDGVADLVASLVSRLPVHPAYYPLDLISEHSERFLVSERIREKIFEKFKEEIPYSTAVDIVEFREREGRKDVINAEIYVERESQKGILIGERGRALKEIGELARRDIEEFLGRPVFLELHVKVREKWREKDQWLKRLGYKHA